MPTHIASGIISHSEDCSITPQLTSSPCCIPLTVFFHKSDPTLWCVRMSSGCLTVQTVQCLQKSRSSCQPWHTALTLPNRWEFYFFNMGPVRRGFAFNFTPEECQRAIWHFTCLHRTAFVVWIGYQAPQWHGNAWSAFAQFFHKTPIIFAISFDGACVLCRLMVEAIFSLGKCFHFSIMWPVHKIGR